MSRLPSDAPSPIPGTHRIEVPDEDLSLMFYGDGDVSTPDAWGEETSTGITCWFLGEHRAHVTEWSDFGSFKKITYCVEATHRENIREACRAYCERPGYGPPVWDAGLS